MSLKNACFIGLVCLYSALGPVPRTPAQARQVLLGPNALTRGGQAPQTGIAVRMFESPTLDRFVRKAQDFLDRGDHAGAIKVLQDVLEGNIHVGALEAGQDESSPSDEEAAQLEEDDPAHAVFSDDERLYRPVRRLCQHMLAAMPPEGLALYREMFEVVAEREYQRALEDLDLRALEATYNRYTVTFSAVRAMYAAGDLLMHQGRYRSAIQTYRSLLELYPAEFRAQVAGIDDRYIDLKIALCFAEVGENAQARQRMAALAHRDPRGALRVAGELVPLATIGERHDLVARGREVAPATATGPSVVRSLDDGLVPLWMHTFADPEPYRRPKTSNSRNRVVFQQGILPSTPRHSQFVPGTTARFEGSRVAFMDHFRLRIHDLGTGLVQSRSEGSDLPRPPKQGYPRSRIPAYDWAALRVAADAERYYCVLGPGRRDNPTGFDTILRNEIVAYDRLTLDPVWSTRAPVLGDVYSGTTFLATPTAFGQTLLVPILAGGAYGMQAIDAETGEPRYRVHIHMRGTVLARAPAMPVVVERGTAYVLTNAGTLASIDAYSGNLHWIRKYERTHPLRPSRRSRRSRGTSALAVARSYQEVSLTGFAPSDLLFLEGRIIVAPTDGDALICVDGASGEPLWFIRKPEEEGVYVLGHHGRFLYLASAASLLCIDHRTGVRQWAVEVPEARWSGRGLVAADRVVLPGDRCVWTLPADGTGRWSRTDLPGFSIGRSPLSGPSNLFADGAYLLVCYEGGVESYASMTVLREMAAAAQDPVDRATLLIQAGELSSAIDVLAPLAEDDELAADVRARHARRALRLTRDVGLALASHGARDEAMALLERAKSWLIDRNMLLQWHLLRVELFETLREPDHVAQAQDELYSLMEGKR